MFLDVFGHLFMMPMVPSFEMGNILLSEISVTEWEGNIVVRKFCVVVIVQFRFRAQPRRKLDRGCAVVAAQLSERWDLN